MGGLPPQMADLEVIGTRNIQPCWTLYSRTGSRYTTVLDTIYTAMLDSIQPCWTLYVQPCWTLYSRVGHYTAVLDLQGLSAL